MFCGILPRGTPIDSESVNLSKPFLVKADLVFAMVLHVLCAMMSHALGCHPYQGLCATSSEPLLIPAVNLKQLKVLAGAEQKLLKLVGLIRKRTRGTAEPCLKHLIPSSCVLATSK